ncbi:hypothetical protein BVG16_29120 [Paenibacillus selenitireducens]|uniref:histidine kinase n=1 Tax=Paenibacillus selenitireducens TaxID=1324314 RepID=A0A1T2X0H6_9BACL|nr:sensor histidine kinase [Paenibacillus selenitireducens]OPA73394.1 hypothetical protein BVG16_29120 [Paenibacillus selenitireducens]
METRAFVRIGQWLIERSRVILLNLILLYVIFETSVMETWLDVIMHVGFGIAYSLMLWMRSYPRSLFGRLAIVIGLWLITVIYFLIFHLDKIAMGLILYLIGYSAVRLPGRRSVPLVSAMILTDALILYMRQESDNTILLYSVVHAGIYLLFWGVRTKRLAAIASKQHYEQLQNMHLQLAQTHEALQQTHKELEEATVQSLRYAVLEERTRIARDLHDSIGHGLTSVIVQLQALPYMIQSNEADAERTLGTVLEVARGCLQDVRLVVHHMAVDDSSLGVVALRSLIQQIREHSNLQIDFSMSPSNGQLRYEIAEILYRILQEALTNVLRHAGASHVGVELIEREENMLLVVKDDGRYTEETTLTPGFGLSGVQARCESVGGSFTYRASKPHGLELTIKIPLNSRPAEGGR